MRASQPFDRAVLTKAQFPSILFAFLTVILIPTGFISRWLLRICDSQYLVSREKKHVDRSQGSGDASEAAFWKPDSLPFISWIFASCSTLLIGLFFFGRDGAAEALFAAGRGGGSVGSGAYLRTKLRSLYRTSLESSSMSSSISSS